MIAFATVWQKPPPDQIPNTEYKVEAASTKHTTQWSCAKSLVQRGRSAIAACLPKSTLVFITFASNYQLQTNIFVYILYSCERPLLTPQYCERLTYRSSYIYTHFLELTPSYFESTVPLSSIIFIVEVSAMETVVIIKHVHVAKMIR